MAVNVSGWVGYSQKYCVGNPTCLVQKKGMKIGIPEIGMTTD